MNCLEHSICLSLDLLNERVAERDASTPHDFTQQVWPLRSLFGQLDNCRQLLLNRNFCIYAHLNEWYFFQFWNFHLEIFPSFTKFLFILAGISDTFCHKEIHEKNEKGIFFTNYTMRTNLLNWCNLVSISKNVVFYAFLVVRINYLLFSWFCEHLSNN